ncbi:MAG: PH domain-containing protein [Pyrinomonadaceae bacterium]
MTFYCQTCGSSIAPGARFCSGCGSIAVDPETTRMAAVNVAAPTNSVRDTLPSQTRNAESNEVERAVFTISPTRLFVKTGYAAAAMCSIMLIVLLALVNAPPLASVLFGLSLLLVPAFYHFRLNTIRYTLTDSKIEISEGLFAKTTRNIPLRNIQDVTVSASIAQRLLGVGNILIDNASEAGGKTILRNIRNPRRHADLLLRELRRWR